MLNINDFKEKQLVLIGSQEMGEKVRFRNENLVLDRNNAKTNQLSCHKILAVFILGNTTITSNFIKQATSFGISVFLMNKNFRLYASIDALAEGNYLLRSKQYQSRSLKDFYMAKELVKEKVLNQLRLLSSADKLEDYKNRKSLLIKKIDQAKDGKTLLGIEGAMSKEFFSVYFEPINWYRREPRTKIDPANLLLDMGYTFLFNYIDCLLRLYGFDVYKGFYHKFFFKRKSLSCDLMEPFRPLIDRAVMKIYNLKIYHEKDFKVENGRFVLSWKKSRKYSQLFLREITKYKLEIFKYVLNFYKFMMDNPEYTNFPKSNLRFK
jgi:CRISPR-associated protein Cas1